MSGKQLIALSGLLFIAATILPAHAQVLSLKEAVNTALQHYGTIRAKASYVEASRAGVSLSRKEYLPDLTLSFQQDYGTVNGNTGPLYGLRGLSVASSGPALEEQNWHSAFGALYLANVNWEFFSFGRAREKINVSKAVLARDQSDLEQEQFQHGIKVAAAYLNLLAAQRLTISWQKNLDRATALQSVVTVRARNGLNPGVDSSLANAEVSNAKIALTRSRDNEQEQSNLLARLMGVEPQDFVLDTLFITHVPGHYLDTAGYSRQQHPLLGWYQRRIDWSNRQAGYFKTFNYPSFSLFSVFQGRGSGFDYDYGLVDAHGFTRDYFKGIDPKRANYLIGVGMVWNITNPLRVHEQVSAQQFITKGLQAEYELVDQQLRAQLTLADQKIRNALDNYLEVPVQIKAASDAYLQKSVLYRNGLATIVEITQALYALNRAETDRDIAYSNVWQALLLKAAASGDANLFMNEF